MGLQVNIAGSPTHQSSSIMSTPQRGSCSKYTKCCASSTSNHVRVLILPWSLLLSPPLIARKGASDRVPVIRCQVVSKPVPALDQDSFGGRLAHVAAVDHGQVAAKGGVVRSKGGRVGQEWRFELVALEEIVLFLGADTGRKGTSADLNLVRRVR